MQQLKRKLQTVNISPERLHFYNLSAAEGPRWAEICSEFSKKIIALGPSPIWIALKRKQGTGTPGEPAAEIVEGQEQ